MRGSRGLPAGQMVGLRTVYRIYCTRTRGEEDKAVAHHESCLATRLKGLLTAVGRLHLAVNPDATDHTPYSGSNHSLMTWDTLELNAGKGSAAGVSRIRSVMRLVGGGIFHSAGSAGRLLGQPYTEALPKPCSAGVAGGAIAKLFRVGEECGGEGAKRPPTRILRLRILGVPHLT